MSIKIINILKGFSSLFLQVAKLPLYGGQALIGGVMMKGKSHYSISTIQNNRIKTRLFPYHSLTKKYKPLGIPFVRGIILLFEMLIIGYKSLMYATEIAYDEIEEKENKSDKKKSSSSDTVFTITMFFSLILSLVFAIGLFKLLPLGIAKLADHYFNFSSIVFNLIDGIVKLSIFVAYLTIIGMLSDIKDVFRFHGAEHKTINCYEQKRALTIKNVSSCSTRHLRCGTTFLLMVLVLSIGFYIFIPKTLPFYQNALLRLAFMPIIASISYEIQRYGAKSGNRFFVTMLKPGLLLQGLTTNEPSPRHLRAGIASLKAIIEKEESNSKEPTKKV